MVHPLNELKNLKKATAELNRFKRAAAAIPATPEELEDLRQGIAILEGEIQSQGSTIEAQGVLIAKLADFVDLPEDYEIHVEEPAGDAVEDPAQDPEGIALVEAIHERKAESE